MKKTILFFLFIGLGMSANAQTIPTTITDQFQKMYSNAAASDWKEGGDGNFIAHFKLDGNDAKAVFSSDAIWVKTIIFISGDKLPDAVLATIKATFAGGFSFIEAEIIKSSGEDIYEAEIDANGAHFKVLLDKAGKLLSKKEI
jgi:hypothetical protein